VEQTFRAICPKGLESLLQDEMARLGATSTRENPGSVTFTGDMKMAYIACLWSRLANRVLLPLGTADVSDAEQLYNLANSVDWAMHMDVKHRFKVDFRGTSKNLNHEQFNARTVKDAIADQFREEFGKRPDVDLKSPDIWIFAHLHKGKCTLYLDLSGPSLHRRGYRLDQGEAPIKENLAAALLIRAGWLTAEPETPLVDPLCGSGTLLLEGLLMRADIAPGLYREKYGFSDWLGHDEKLWQTCLADAQQRAEQGRQSLVCHATGFETDKRTLRAAQANIGRLELEGHINIIAGSFSNGRENYHNALIISNPPYGERLGDLDSLIPTYKAIGRWLKQQIGSRAALICSEQELMQQTEIRASKRYKFYNGKIACQLYCFELEEVNFFTREQDPAKNERLAPLINRLKKNIAKADKLARRDGLDAVRIYEHDLPEYAFSVDRYLNHYVIYETQAPKHISENKVNQHRRELLTVLQHVTQASKSQILLKTRQKQKGTAQYQKQAKSGQRMVIKEQGLEFYVNLTDYLDTGIFLDHRLIRERIRKLVKGKRFLNLFCYTGAVTVYAAAGQASETTSVDMSNTYLNWAKDNLKLNHLAAKQHQFVKQDCVKWLANNKRPYDVIFLDPPSFSNSKSMDKHLDIQADHESLIASTMNSLSRDGVLIFSTNRKGFKLSENLSENFQVQDLGQTTISPDFRAHRPPHHCWEIRHSS
jgi:23S rRNA (guanine2445-N2)-methyltransferase / 23S rRNA (guanine2069-N7)-methyltransferase